MDICELTKVINHHRQKMISYFENEDVDLLSQEFTYIRSDSREEFHFNQALQDSTAKLLAFKYFWITNSNRFLKLQQLCGGLASAPPNNSTVE